MKTTLNGATREIISEYAERQYGTTPDYPWASLPLYFVLRRADNKKWYGVVMNVAKNRLGLSGSEPVDILVAKCNPFMQETLLRQDGFLPAYHMNR